MTVSLFIFVLEILGTIAFSISGAMIGIQKNMDLFGVLILGLITAVGGGVIRDVTLGITPPATFQNPAYAVTALLTAFIVFLPPVQRLFHKFQHAYDTILFAMDALGLGIFTVIGVEAAFQRSGSYGMFLLVFVGVITGVGGGVLRDVLAGLPPYIFVKHIYACASLLGAVLCAALWPIIPNEWAMAIGCISVITLRTLSAYFHWSLPKPFPDRDSSE